MQADEEMYRLIVNEISDGILVLDADFVARFANPAMRRILGYSPDELDGVWAGDLVWSESVRVFLQSGQVVLGLACSET